jgi:hypothetical protein
MAAPRAAVAAEQVAALADADARDNWQVFLQVRARLLAAPTLEAAFLAIVRGGTGRFPALVLAQLAHVILRSALDGCADAFVLRAAELFFRPQRVSPHAGRILLADEEAVTRHEGARRNQPLSAMLAPPAAAGLDVLTPDNAAGYWARSDAFDLVLDLADARPALARAMAAWLRHLLGITAVIEPVERIEDAEWRWFIGLDAEATRIGNALWRGEHPEAAEHLLALFRVVPGADMQVREDMRGQPVYLLLAAPPEGVLRMKPQNLLVGLPLAEPP